MRLRRRRQDDGANPGDARSQSDFPEFPYHPDPRATGFVVESKTRCRACGRSRGYIYRGPVYAVEELDDTLCPWCIADGTAAAKFGATFTDVDWGVPTGLPLAVTEQIARRTPGFTGWQQEHWLYHCGDGAAFLGVVGRKELEPYPDAVEALRNEALDDYDWPPEHVDDYLASLAKDGQPTAYLFRCRHCRRHLAYSDFT